MLSLIQFHSILTDAGNWASEFLNLKLFHASDCLIRIVKTDDGVWAWALDFFLQASETLVLFQVPAFLILFRIVSTIL